MSTSKYFFAYDASLDPDRLAAVSPGAGFLFTAHYPETRLEFVTTGAGAPLPTLVHDSGHTVWGGVFDVPGPEVEALVAGLGEGRQVGYEGKAVDREGNKHDCMTFVVAGSQAAAKPDLDYVDAMIRGARHWGLPAGWVLGLEDLVEDPLFS